MKPTICYFSEETKFVLRHKRKVTAWLHRVVQDEGHRLDRLVFVFCSDACLLVKNRTYLNHDTLTDVLSFDYATQPKTILGEIYISIERVRDNAKYYQTPPQVELHTVMVHGLLHLLGYGDATEAERGVMREKERWYVSQWDLPAEAS